MDGFNAQLNPTVIPADAEFPRSSMDLPDCLAYRLKPATPEKLQNGGNEIDRCCICLSNFDHDPTNLDEPVCSAPSVLVCGHIFGRRCILQHMDSQPFWVPTCPLCRRPSLYWPDNRRHTTTRRDDDDTLSFVEVDMESNVEGPFLRLEDLPRPEPEPQPTGPTLDSLEDDVRELMETGEFFFGDYGHEAPAGSRGNPIDLAADEETAAGQDDEMDVDEQGGDGSDKRCGCSLIDGAD